MKQVSKFLQSSAPYMFHSQTQPADHLCMLATTRPYYSVLRHVEPKRRRNS
uniref:Uncharacterized protein n=1 Tax=Arundo donax TaxID=35708 RepID=A0A0A9A4T3_ARUDO